MSQLCHTNRTPKSQSNSPELFNRLRPAPQHCPPQQWVVSHLEPAALLSLLVSLSVSLPASRLLRLPSGSCSGPPSLHTDMPHSLPDTDTQGANQSGNQIKITGALDKTLPVVKVGYSQWARDHLKITKEQHYLNLGLSSCGII